MLHFRVLGLMDQENSGLWYECLFITDKVNIAGKLSIVGLSVGSTRACGSWRFRGFTVSPWVMNSTSKRTASLFKLERARSA